MSQLVNDSVSREQVVRLIAMAASAAVTVGGIGMASSAWAYDPSINGTYTATVVGDWARTNQIFHQEPVVRSTWKINTSCSTAQDCKGEVNSDQGWTAHIYTHDGHTWFVKREIPNWETCPDGTSYTGHDVVHFYAADPVTGEGMLGSPVLAGREQTTGKSGACGVNLPLYIDQPFRLDKIR